MRLCDRSNMSLVAAQNESNLVFLEFFIHRHLEDFVILCKPR